MVNCRDKKPKAPTEMQRGTVKRQTSTSAGGHVRFLGEMRNPREGHYRPWEFPGGATFAHTVPRY